MSKKRLGNLFKRKFGFSLKKLMPVKKSEVDLWAKKELLNFSRFGGEIILMKMGD